MGIKLLSKCRSCECPIWCDKDKYEEEGEYAYWYPTDAAWAADHRGAGDCYCPDYSTEPHHPGDYTEEDDGCREVNLSAAARAALAGLVTANQAGLADVTWAELRAAFPVPA